MGKRFGFVVFAFVCCLGLMYGGGKVSVDKDGVMRYADGSEVSYFGTNYTLPFAHSYREALRRGKDPKEAIREDVYHLGRLGFNGFRVHLWDVELADSLGNLQSNDHLDLMDYLIAELEKKGIDIVLTAQTNFGNGYPERNIDTGSFSYDFPKCEVHDNASAQRIQENYLRQLSRHVNKYTGKSYQDDDNIIGLEINNEPCHSASPEAVRKYIDRMIRAMRQEGWDKPLFYNASHNFGHTKAFYESKADGLTFQWYPTGLVAGHERKGNMLPAVDSYDIPWRDSMPNYGKKARIVYEFDPGDISGSYLYPAIARSFRKEGFQWITQFAYDAMFLAPYNTDYQTHYMNLAYTPGKALSLKIAGEAARETERGADYGRLPEDTVFGNFRVSYARDLSDYDNGRKYFYSNTTDRRPQQADSIREIAGRGTSPVVAYAGTGAYFLDRLPGDIWRLEVMPDVYLTEDPYERPAPDRKVGRIVWRRHPMRITLPSLGEEYTFSGINDGNFLSGKAHGGEITVEPGVYILSAGKDAGELASTPDRELREYHAPKADDGMPEIIHRAKPYAAKGGMIEIEAEVAGDDEGVSLQLYPSDIDFWSEDNTIYTLEKRGAGRYGVTVPAGDDDSLSYWLTLTKDGEERSWPGGVKGNPLSWYFRGDGLYTTRLVSGDQPLALLLPDEKLTMTDLAVIPDDYTGHASIRFIAPDGIHPGRYLIKSDGDRKTVVRKYVGDIVGSIPDADKRGKIAVNAERIPSGAKVRLVTRDGASYESAIPTAGRAEISLNDFKAAKTYIIPAPFPAFLNRETEVKGSPHVNATDIEFVEIEIPSGSSSEMLLQGILIDN